MPPKRKPTVHVQPGYGGPVQISEINCNDVLFGRGLSLNNNAGESNVNFKNRIEAAMPEYLISEKHEKKPLAAKVVADIRSANPPGRFLKSVGQGLYEETGDKKAWESEFIHSIHFYILYRCYYTHLTNCRHPIPPCDVCRSDVGIT